MKESPDSRAPDGSSQIELDSEDRRRFLKKASKVAVTAPAVALLLSAGATPRQAHAKMYESPAPPWI